MGRKQLSRLRNVRDLDRHTGELFHVAENRKAFAEKSDMTHEEEVFSVKKIMFYLFIL